MTVGLFARIVEVRTKIVSLTTFAVATLYVLFATGKLSVPLFLLTLAAALCVDMGTTAFNTYFDFVRGVDNRIFNTEQDKVLVHQGVSASAARAVSLGLYGAAVVIGAVIAAFTSVWVALAGAACMLVGFLYTGGPYPISRTPVGEIFAGGFLGGVFFLIVFFIHAGALSAAAVLASLPSTLLIMSMLTVNNTCDIHGDTAAGRKTLSILLGRRSAETMVYILGATAYLSAAVLSVVGVLPVWTLIPLAPAAALSVVAYVAMHKAGFSHATKGQSMRRISLVLLYFSLAMVVGLFLGLVV